jgi:hypothetical protein
MCWSHLQLHHQALVEECRLVQELEEGRCCLGHDGGCIRTSLSAHSMTQRSTAQHSTAGFTTLDRWNQQMEMVHATHSDEAKQQLLRLGFQLAVRMRPPHKA